uniref:General transcription factor IIH subunit 4 n=1 Tax=Panagrellus redivivus TaxID=6233 RepID=A0A7E5A198_PANRE
MATAANVADYPFLKLLMKMPISRITLVYKSPPACLFTLNMLDASVRDVVNFLLTAPPIKLEEVCLPQGRLQLRKVLDLLTSLKIVYLQDGVYSVCPNFRQSVISAMTIRQRCTAKFNRMKEGKDKIKKMNVTDLFQRAIERWDTILKHLITSGGEAISLATTDMFRELKYMNVRENGTKDITSKGFQFLLLSRHAQCWHYLSAYLRHVTKEHPEHCADLIDIFCSLIMLAPTLPTTVSKSSFFTMTHEEPRYEVPYRIPTYPHDVVNNFFLHMRELGFVYIRKRKDGYFYITPMLSMLRMTGSVGVDAGMPLAKADGFLVSESNYRVYAYTNDHLQLSILNTFTEADGAFADMVMTILTRGSVRRAFDQGITAAQIIAFMRSNSHPITIEKFGPVGCVPQTIVDQIELWESERSRFSHTSGVLITNFIYPNEFKMAVDFAKGNNFLKWSNPLSKKMIIDADAHEKFKQWWTSQRGRQA